MQEDHGHSWFYSKRRISQYCSYSTAIYISDVVKEVIEKKFKFKKSYTVINQVRYSNSFKRTRKFMEDGECNILIVGSIDPGKGQEQAIKAVKRLHSAGYNVQLSICGTGDFNLINYLLDDDTKNYVQCLGFRNDVEEVRKENDIALVCSRMEAFGRVTVEALYYKNIVIAANAGCTPYIIRSGVNGYLYELDNIDDLVSKIIYCIQNKDKMDKLANKASLNAIAKYSKSIYSKVYTIYKETIHNE